MKRLTFLLLGAVTLLGCDAGQAPLDPESSFAVTAAPKDGTIAAHSPPSAAVMRFGNPNAGSPFPPPDHDRSFHSSDKINPRTVVISAGGTVTFEVNPAHMAAVYESGTEPADIEVSPATVGPLGGIPDFGIFDPNGLLGMQPVSDFSFTTPSSWEFTFDQPGRYLVICIVVPHFLFANMYGWVIVK